MTDNEQKAHDISVALIHVMRNDEVSEEETRIDFYKRYFDTYQTVLKSLRRDFPEGDL